MNKPTVPDLKELFKQASEIAQQVPENMQEAAFNRAIDLLTNDQNNSLPPPKNSSKRKRVNRASETQTANVLPPSEDDDLLSKINSTQHPGVISATKVVDRALMVLQIALSDHDVDGLTPGAIANILTKKFRIKTSPNNVNVALGRATHLVDRESVGQGYSYKIMAPGEKYLAHQNDATNSAPTPQGKPKAKRIQSPKKKNEPKTRNNTKGKDKKLDSKKKSGLGPKAAILEMIEAGYFSKVRTGSELQEYLKKNRGFGFGTDQLRVALLRLLRDQKLDRDQNAEGQYVYKTPGT